MAQSGEEALSWRAGSLGERAVSTHGHPTAPRALPHVPLPHVPLLHAAPPPSGTPNPTPSPLAHPSESWDPRSRGGKGLPEAQVPAPSRASCPPQGGTRRYCMKRKRGTGQPLRTSHPRAGGGLENSRRRRTPAVAPTPGSPPFLDPRLRGDERYGRGRGAGGQAARGQAAGGQAAAGQGRVKRHGKGPRALWRRRQHAPRFAESTRSGRQHGSEGRTSREAPQIGKPRMSGDALGPTLPLALRINRASRAESRRSGVPNPRQWGQNCPAPRAGRRGQTAHYGPHQPTAQARATWRGPRGVAF